MKNVKPIPTTGVLGLRSENSKIYGTNKTIWHPQKGQPEMIRIESKYILTAYLCMFTVHMRMVFGKIFYRLTTHPGSSMTPAIIIIISQRHTFTSPIEISLNYLLVKFWLWIRMFWWEVINICLLSIFHTARIERDLCWLCTFLYVNVLKMVIRIIK